MLKSSGTLQSRIPALAAVITIMILLGIGTYMRGSVADAWQWFRIPSAGPLFIPSGSPLFADTRTITNSIDCVAAGQNPYTVRSFDPWHRLYNYPPIWLQARYLGVTSRSSNLIGTMLSLIMACTCVILFRAKTWASALIIFFAVTSHSVLFAVERGNTDQLIFSLLVFGFFFIERLRVELQSLFSGLLIGLLTILKVYPIVAAVVIVRSRSSIIKALLIVFFSIAALLLTSGHSLIVLLANTPQGTGMSFGAFPFFLVIGRHIVPSSVPLLQGHHSVASIGAIILGALALVAAHLYRVRINQFLPQLDFDHARGQLAISGLAIFCSSFISGSSFDYRLIFLLGVLAYLVEDLNNITSRRSLPTAVLILLLMWGSFRSSFIHEILDGLTFILASAWLGTSLLSNLAKRESTTLLQSTALKTS